MKSHSFQTRSRSDLAHSLSLRRSAAHAGSFHLRHDSWHSVRLVARCTRSGGGLRHRTRLVESEHPRHCRKKGIPAGDSGQGSGHELLLPGNLSLVRMGFLCSEHFENYPANLYSAGSSIGTKAVDEPNFDNLYCSASPVKSANPPF